jgi:hypothetical protein
MKNILLFFAAVAVSLLMAEAAMRMAGFMPRAVRVNPFFVPGSETTWSVPDTELGWINKEGVSRAIEGDGVDMTFWSFGRRATRANPAMPTDAALKVMLIGGSNLQSYGVKDEESFPYLLGQRYPDIGFENFGSGGYSTVQAKLLAERALVKFYGEKRPALMLLAFDDAHILRNVADQSWLYAISDAEGRYVAPPHYRLVNGKLAFHPFRTIGFWPLERQSAALTALHNVWLQSVMYNSAAEALPVTRAVVTEIAELAKEAGIVFAAVILDDRGQTAKAVFEGQSFPWHDCSGLERTAPQEYMLKEGSHPNPKLHAHLAACIGDWLDAEILPTLRK